MGAQGQTTSVVLVANAIGNIGTTEGGDAVKTGQGRLIGLSFVGGAAAPAIVRVYDGLTVAGGRHMGTFYCGPTSTGAHFDSMDIDLYFRTGLTVFGVGHTAGPGTLSHLTLIYE